MAKKTTCGNASWSRIPLSLLKTEGISFLFEYNYGLKLLKSLSPQLNFTKTEDVSVYTWQMINQHIPENKEQILNKILRNNRFIEIEKSPSVYYQSWHKTGVIRIKDIFCENNFLTFCDFYQNNFLAYYGLCSSVPQKWICLLKQSNPNTPTNLEYVEKIPLSKLS